MLHTIPVHKNKVKVEGGQGGNRTLHEKTLTLTWCNAFSGHFLVNKKVPEGRAQ